MKLFECSVCGQPLYFENDRCESCAHRLGYLHETTELVPLDPVPEGNGLWMVAGSPQRRYRFCRNAEQNVCNWLVEPWDQNGFCRACRHNQTIPALADPQNLHRWQLIEQAKHRLFYSLILLGLPLRTRGEDPVEGLAFDFLADGAASSRRVMTGHDHGLITLNIAEADDVERERRRHSMGEAYRTLLGHFRHEIGHYYWDRLVRDRPAALARCRQIFGDERQDYEGALSRHYGEGSPPDWRERYVTAYASAHPWEDFAESFAHYLHIVDTLETASAFRLCIEPRIARGAELSAMIDFDPRHMDGVQSILREWLPLTFAVNSLNRGMGQPDLYPFVLSQAVVGKLGFIHDLVRGWPVSRGDESQGFAPSIAHPAPA